MPLTYVKHLPEVVKQVIQSYLYFSDPVSRQMRIVNYTILHYDKFLWDEISAIFHNRMFTLYFRITLFLENNLHQYNKKFLPITDDAIKKYVQNLFLHFNVIEKQKAYNYIMFGSS